jgi:hypothetical protein
MALAPMTMSRGARCHRELVWPGETRQNFVAKAPIPAPNMLLA